MTRRDSPKSKLKRKKRYAKKSLGQNFLVDQNIIRKIISILDVQPNQTIVEIGAGRGALTKSLVERAEKVLAIEIDRDLIPELREKFGDKNNFHLIEDDALEINFQNLVSLQTSPKKTKLVGNLPYYISTAILQYLIQYRNSFSQLILMLQKEVIDRITAEAGTKDRGYLTVLILAFFETEKLFDVPPTAFRPVPKVTSGVVRLTPKTNSIIADEEIFKQLISLSFRKKRKTIKNNLRDAEGKIESQIINNDGLEVVLEKTGIDPNRRAETLEIDEWIRLANFLSSEKI